MSEVRVAVVMGVSGSGKTTLARALADAWEATFLDADDFHSDEARALMASGQPLTDELRQPWAARIATDLQRRVADGARVSLAFSGLRRQHRDVLRATGLPLRFLFLRGEPALIGQRMCQRGLAAAGHAHHHGHAHVAHAGSASAGSSTRTRYWRPASIPENTSPSSR